ncbi:uncharacterized protein GGS22DRAFT_84953 [Annulohypoxylon maeteangense]|uniref:uncharacterized protein n=1 Tax=Annulohypoxylon maeteangense TaxID=1927788 RepID=UPI0020088BDD|nr:uncharacterized protein GGS22DRAFT_84953 [Annulohypoxylon maeteangense]KAI0880367.1 hypothetical protein GGS22DRAFT_84953 [Annulohypoxylon maeteangense]
MSAYDPYDAPPREYSRRYHHDERRDRASPRYTETQETYYRVNPNSRNALVPRAREDSELSVEEIHRDFPPPGYSRDVRRTRSAEPGYDDYYYEGRRSYDTAPKERRHKKPGSVYYEEEERSRNRVLSKQEKIIAAVAGGLLAAGAKELWDRREAEKEGVDVHRNVAASAALGAAGAFAGYQGADYYNKHSSKEDKKSTYIVHKGRDGRVVEYYSDDEDEDPRDHKGNKSFLENALAAAGLGGAIKALTGGAGSDKDSRSRHGSRRGSPDSYRSRDSRKSSRDTPAARMQKAAKASLVAGAAEAFRVAKEPGGWKGEKMKRVLTAAAGAATIDAAHDPSKDSKRHLVEAVVGGLLGNRMLHGSRKDIEEDRRTGRSRSRSRARSEGGSGGSGLAALATAGLGALTAKKLVGSRSRSRSRRGDSVDSYDSRSPSPRRRRSSRSRSRSVVDKARRSLAKIGIGSDPDHRDDDSYYDDRPSRKSRHRSSSGGRYDDDDDHKSRAYMRGGRGPATHDSYDDYDEEERSIGGGRSRSGSRSRKGRSSSASSSDLGDSDEDKKMTSKMRRKQLVTTGLAAVATIHAAHNVYGSMGQRDARHRAVKEGKLSPEEARKLRTKALLQDAASVGIAAMGVKGAISELKEAREQAKAVTEWKEERQRRHERRLERLKRANSSYSGRSRADNWNSSAPPKENRYEEGPRYTDGNPYSAALPAPPLGYDRR